MSPVLNNNAILAATLPKEPKAKSPSPKLNIAVVLTSVASTLPALKTAGLDARMDGCLTLLVPRIVPYPLPLTSPPVLLDFSKRRFCVLTNKYPVDTSVRIYLFGDRETTLKSVLEPRSLVVIGAKKRWWPSPERRLAWQLRRAGHKVVLAEN